MFVVYFRNVFQDRLVAFIVDIYKLCRYFKKLREPGLGELGWHENFGTRFEKEDTTLTRKTSLEKIFATFS